MSRQAAIGIGDWLAARFSAVAPDWLRAMFLGYPLARTIVLSDDAPGKTRGVLSTSILIEASSPATKKRRIRTADIIVPEKYFLKRNIRVPREARNKLALTAELDLRQRTPFNPQDVFWQLDSPQQADGFIHATQWVVKKADVDAWRANLLTQGIRVRSVFVAGTRATTPIADFAHRLAPWRRPLLIVNGGLALVTMAAVCVGWLYPGWVAHQQAQTIEAQVQALRVEAVDLRREVETMRANDMERTAFLDTILRRPLLVDTLREITVALPDDVWISSLVYVPSRVVLNGETANSAAQLVLKLGERRSFGNPRLSGPVQRTAARAERFEITVDLGKSN